MYIIRAQSKVGTTFQMDSSTIDFRVRSPRWSMLSSDLDWPMMSAAALQYPTCACSTNSSSTFESVSIDFSTGAFSKMISSLLALMWSMLVLSPFALIVSRSESSSSGMSSSQVVR